MWPRPARCCRCARILWVQAVRRMAARLWTRVWRHWGHSINTWLCFACLSGLVFANRTPCLRPRRCSWKTQSSALRAQRSHLAPGSPRTHFIFTALHRRHALGLFTDQSTSQSLQCRATIKTHTVLLLDGGSSITPVQKVPARGLRQ